MGESLSYFVPAEVTLISGLHCDTASAKTFHARYEFGGLRHAVDEILETNSAGIKGTCLFNDTWSQKGHSVSCMTIPFLTLQMTRADIRPHIQWAVSLVIADGHFNLPQGFVWVCMS